MLVCCVPQQEQLLKVLFSTVFFVRETRTTIFVELGANVKRTLVRPRIPKVL